MKCRNCGSENDPSSRFCITCGTPLYAAAQTSPVKPKKRRGCIAALLVLLAIVIGIAVLASVVLPGLFKPKKLGIDSTQESYESAMLKLNYTKDTAPLTGKAEDYVYTYGAPTQVSTSLTSEELTSFFNYNRPDYYALKDVQIRINPDNTIEFSAKIDTEYIIKKVLGGDYTEDEINNAIPFIKFIPASVNIYSHFSGEIVDNKALSFEVSDVKVMGFGLPVDLYKTTEAQTQIIALIDNLLVMTTEKTKGTFTSIKVENGELKITGSLPSTLTRVGVN